MNCILALDQGPKSVPMWSHEIMRLLRQTYKVAQVVCNVFFLNASYSGL